MPKRRLGRRLLHRLSADLQGAAELGLALLMTAGVASCGGKTAGSPTTKADGTGTGTATSTSTEACEPGGPFGCATDGTGMSTGTYTGTVIDGPAFPEGGVVEAAVFDGGPVVDGPRTFDGGVVIDGPPPPITDASFGFDGPVIDGPAFIEGGVTEGAH